MKISDIGLQQNFIITSVQHPDQTMQRRLYDLGFYPGTTVKKVLVSPKKDPLAYEIRHTVIALRNADAQYIEVKEGEF